MPTNAGRLHAIVENDTISDAKVLTGLWDQPQSDDFRIAATTLLVCHLTISFATFDTARGVRSWPLGTNPTIGFPYRVAISISS